MRPSCLRYAIALAAALAAQPATALQDTALKDLRPKGMVVGVAVNQQQFERTDAAAADLITKQFNQISPENALKFQRSQPPTATRSRPRITTFSSASITTYRWSDTISSGIHRPAPGCFRAPTASPRIANAGGATDFCARFLDADDHPLQGIRVRLGSE